MEVWNVLHVARWKYSTKKLPKIHHLGTIAQLCRHVSLQLRHISTIKENLLNRNTSSTCPHQSPYGELRPTNGWDRFGSLGTPANFNGFRVLASLLQWRHSPEANQTLYDVWTSPGLLHYIYTFGGSCPWRNFSQCKIHFASLSCVLLYCQRYCTALQPRASAKLCGVVQGMELWNFCRGRHLYSAGRPSR